MFQRGIFISNWGQTHLVKHSFDVRPLFVYLQCCQVLVRCQVSLFILLWIGFQWCHCVGVLNNKSRSLVTMTGWNQGFISIVAFFFLPTYRYSFCLILGSCIRATSGKRFRNIDCRWVLAGLLMYRRWLIEKFQGLADKSMRAWKTPRGIYLDLHPFFFFRVVLG